MMKCYYFIRNMCLDIWMQIMSEYMHV